MCAKAQNAVWCKRRHNLEHTHFNQIDEGVCLLCSSISKNFEEVTANKAKVNQANDKICAYKMRFKIGACFQTERLPVPVHAQRESDNLN